MKKFNADGGLRKDAKKDYNEHDLNNYSGAFYIESYENYILTLKKNPNYWGKDGVIIPGITFIQSDNEDANAYDFNQGKADWVKANTSVAKILNPQNLYIAAVFGTSFLFFKQNNFPWNIAEFRQALLEALPYDELRKNYSVKAKTFIYPLTGYPKVEGIEDYDLDFAKELMSEARKKNGISQTEKIKIVFGISQEKFMYDLAEQLKKAWEPLGVELVTQATPSNRYANSIEAWNADLFSYSWIGDFADPMAFLEMYRSSSSLNVSGFKNDEFDKMLLDSDLETNEYSRYEILSKAEQFLLNQNVIIPLAHSIEVHLIDLNVIGGWTTNALDIHPLKNLYIKPPKCTVPNLVMLD